MDESDDELEERLRNWGRWAREKPVRYSSPLQKIIEMNPENVQVELPQNPVDYTDALIIQRAWQRMPLAPYRYKMARIVIAYRYIYPYEDVVVRLIKINKVKGVHRRDIEKLHALGKTIIRNRLKQIDWEKLQ